MFGKYLLFAAALLSGRSLYAGPCTIQSLAVYEGLTPNVGCTIGASGIFVYNFTFSAMNAIGVTPITASNITVTPTFTTNVFSLNFGATVGATGFSVGSGQSVQYVIGYTWDPDDDIQSMDDLEDPPAFTSPGSSGISSVGCLNTPTCSSTATVNVFDGPSSAQLTNSVSFAAVAVLPVQNTLSLQGGSGGSASLDGFTNEVTVPEPATWLTGVAFLGLLLLRRTLFGSRLLS